MRNELIHGLIKNLDDKLESSLIQFEKVDKEVSVYLSGNPELTSDEFVPALIKHSDIRHRSITYLKLMVMLRSYLNPNCRYILGVEKSSGIKIDSKTEQLLINEKMHPIMSNIINVDALDKEIFTSRAYDQYINKVYEYLMSNDRFEACSIIDTMRFSYN